jgi:DNA-binding beta-propeller fold protein YncE
MGSDYRPDRHPTSSHKRAKNLKLLLCALALGTLLASSAFAQVLDGTILLPDSLGPLPGATCVALDDNPAHPRMFVGSDSGDVLVVNSRTGERVARMETGPVRAICYSPARNKLYISLMNSYNVVVLDCNTYETIAELQIGRLVSGLLYNPLVDRVYCACWGMKVIDCATDSIVDSLPIPARKAVLALDTIHNKLYVGATDTFRVVDCNSNSIVASLYELRGAEAICFAPSISGSKVYVGISDTLFALSVKIDTVVYRHVFYTANPIVCDPQHGRVYFGAYGGNLTALDCATDSVIWGSGVGPSLGLAAAPAENKVYALMDGALCVLDGGTGQELQWFDALGYSGLQYSASLNRLFPIANGAYQDYTLAIDCAADTIASVIPLGAYVGYWDGSLCVDSTDNKLYFSAGASGVGVVDCRTNEVTSYICPSREQYNTPPSCLAYDAHGGKLYVRKDTSILVLDCNTDTVLKVIPVGAFAFNSEWQMELNPGLNKLYVLTGLVFTHRLVVVDCAADTVCQRLELSGMTMVTDVFLSPELNQLWFLHASYTVIDCVGDSVLTDTNPQLYCRVGSYDPLFRKVYAASEFGTAMHVVDMDTRLPTESLPIPKSYQQESGPVYCAVRAHKVYWVVRYYDPENGSFTDTIVAIDTQTDSITSRFSEPSLSWCVCDDRTGDYVYFASGVKLVAVDVRSDSIVSSVGVAVAAHSFVRNSVTNRLYMAGNTDSVIQVVYDSIIFAGLQAGPGAPAPVARFQTVIRRTAPLRISIEAVLLDATGRGVSVLKDGPNDISLLAPGVYFIRERPQAVGNKPPAVRKVVVAR